jgi:hypothetical protein
MPATAWSHSPAKAPGPAPMRHSKAAAPAAGRKAVVKADRCGWIQKRERRQEAGEAPPLPSRRVVLLTGRLLTDEMMVWAFVPCV